MDWFDFHAVQGTLKSLLQHHSSKASILWHLASFMVQLSHPYMTTVNTIALTRQTFIGKVMSLLFNMLSRLVIAFMAAVTICSDFGAQKNKVFHCFHCLPTYFPRSDGTGCHDLCFLECWVLSQLYQSPLLLSMRGSLVPLHSMPLRWCHLHIWGCWYFFWQSWFQLLIHPAWHFAWCTLHIS